jgi:hypothetical protein
MEATNVEDFRLLHKLPHLGTLKMVELVAIGRSQVGAQTPVVTCDDDTTSTRRLLIVVPVLDSDTGFGADVPEGLSVLVFSNAANVDDRVRR